MIEKLMAIINKARFFNGFYLLKILGLIAGKPHKVTGVMFAFDLQRMGDLLEGLVAVKSVHVS